jgi:hypothetical protein
LINADFRTYNYFTLGADNGYGQPKMPTLDDEPEGEIKIAIYTTSQNIQNSILYKDANYIGLTHAQVDDTYIINFNGELLKVLYTNDKGRFKQVFLKKI